MLLHEGGRGGGGGVRVNCLVILSLQICRRCRQTVDNLLICLEQSITTCWNSLLEQLELKRFYCKFLADIYMCIECLFFQGE